MAVNPRNRGPGADQLRALRHPGRLSARVHRGAHGFTVRLLARIVRDRLAVARPEIVKAGGRTLSMLRLTITDAGRQALAGM
jgi:hypothetical protein